MLISKRIDFESVDGSLPEVKEQRDQLFACSGQRGKYPQLFLRAADGSLRYIGKWDEVQELCECDDLPKDLLDSNPDIKTFSKVFSNVKKRD
jgi:hypothetical protein